MDRRTIEATIYGTLFAFGGAAMIGSFALPDSSPYFQILLVAGLLGLAVGFIGLVYLWWTAPRSKEAPPAPDKQQGSIGIYLGPGVKGAVVEDNTINGMDTAIEDHGTANRHKGNKIAKHRQCEMNVFWRRLKTIPAKH
ncbi:MAG: hypothetical protein IPM41_16125 [Sphingomonadales bacterium]|nr:hypothetical protein [Sphingomonadales bacterium]MBK9005314.1 hypothetical protein [Sphingomonadales bacterium]